MPQVAAFPAAGSRLLCLAVAPALLLSITPLRAQQVVDRGTFTLYVHGAPIGEERFLIRSERAGSSGVRYVAGAELDLKVDGRTQRISVGIEAMGPRARVRRYKTEINGSAAETIVGTVARDRLRLDVRSPRGDEMKEFLVRDRAVVLDRHVAHLYFFAWKQLGGERSTSAQILVPRDRAQTFVIISDVGEETVRVNRRERQLRHITLVGEGGKTHHIWLDGDRVMLVEVPIDGYRAVRSEDQPTN